MSGDGLSCLSAVAAFDDAAEVGEGDAHVAYVEQGAYDGADHVAQEAVGNDFKAPLVGGELCPYGAGDAAEVGFRVRTRFAEAREVRIVGEKRGGLVHESEVGFFKQAEERIV